MKNKKIIFFITVLVFFLLGSHSVSAVTDNEFCQNLGYDGGCYCGIIAEDCDFCSGDPCSTGADADCITYYYNTTGIHAVCCYDYKPSGTSCSDLQCASVDSDWWLCHSTCDGFGHCSNWTCPTDCVPSGCCDEGCEAGSCKLTPNNYNCDASGDIKCKEDCTCETGCADTDPPTERDNKCCFNPKKSGTCTDSGSCSGGCTDSCDTETDILTEYYCTGGSCTGESTVCDGNSCASATKNCNDYDCEAGSLSCTGAGTDTLTERGADYECAEWVGGAECVSYGDKDCGSWTCNSSNECTTQTCAGVEYWCVYSNGYKWLSSKPSTETGHCSDGHDNDCDCFTGGGCDKDPSASGCTRCTNPDPDCVECSDYKTAGACDGDSACAWCPKDKSTSYSPTDKYPDDGKCIKEPDKECSRHYQCGDGCSKEHPSWYCTGGNCNSSCKCVYGVCECVMGKCGAVGAKACDKNNPCTIPGEVCDMNTCQCVPCDKTACEVTSCSTSKDGVPTTTFQPGEEFRIDFQFTPGVNCPNKREIWDEWDRIYSASSPVTPCTTTTEGVATTTPTTQGTYTYEAWCDDSYKTCDITVKDTTPPKITAANIPNCFVPYGVGECDCGERDCQCSNPEKSCAISWKDPDDMTKCSPDCQKFPVLYWDTQDTDIKRFDVYYFDCDKGDVNACLKEMPSATWETATPGVGLGGEANHFEFDPSKISTLKGFTLNHLYFFKIKAEDLSGNASTTDPTKLVAFTKVCNECFTPESANYHGSGEFGETETLDLSVPKTIYLDVPQGATVTAAPIKLTGSPDTAPKDLKIEIGEKGSEKEVYKYNGKFNYEYKGTYGLTAERYSSGDKDAYYTKTGSYTVGGATSATVSITQDLVKPALKVKSKADTEGQKVYLNGEEYVFRDQEISTISNPSFETDKGWIFETKEPLHTAGKRSRCSGEGSSSAGYSSDWKTEGDRSLKLYLSGGNCGDKGYATAKTFMDFSYVKAMKVDINGSDWNIVANGHTFTSCSSWQGSTCRIDLSNIEGTGWLELKIQGYDGTVYFDNFRFISSTNEFDISTSLKRSAKNVLNFDSSADLDWAIFDFKRETFNPGGILKDVKLRLKRTAPITTSVSGGHGYKIGYDNTSYYSSGSASHFHFVVIDGAVYQTDTTTWSHSHGNPVDYWDKNTEDFCYYWDYAGEHTHPLKINGKTYTSSPSGSHKHNTVWRSLGEGLGNYWYRCSNHGGTGTEENLEKQCYSGEHSHTFNIPPFNNPTVEIFDGVSTITYPNTDHSAEIVAGDKGYIEIALPDMENKDYNLVFGADAPKGFKWEIVGNKYAANPDTDVDLQVNGGIENAKITFVGEGLEIGTSAKEGGIGLGVGQGTAPDVTSATFNVQDTSHLNYLRKVTLSRSVGGGVVAQSGTFTLKAGGETLETCTWSNTWSKDTDCNCPKNTNFLIAPAKLSGGLKVEYTSTAPMGIYVSLDYTLSVPTRNPNVTVNGETKSAGELKDSCGNIHQASTQTLTKLKKRINHLNFSTGGPKDILSDPKYEVKSDIGSGKFNYKITGDLTQTVDLASEVNRYLHNCKEGYITCATTTCDSDTCYTVPITFSGTGSTITLSGLKASILRAEEGKSPICDPFNSPPRVKFPDSPTLGCISPSAHLKFTYLDDDGDDMATTSSFHLQIAADKGFTEGVKKDGSIINRIISTADKVIPASTSISYYLEDYDILPKLKYWWRIKVRDSKNAWSEWATSTFDLNPM